MNLREYLRSEWSQYIRPVMVKDKCEFCGSSEELHLHHIDRFHNLLVETLEELQLQELDTEFYDELELKQISNFMLAKQLKSEYKTLCKKCHMKLHNKEKYSEEYKNHYYNPNGGYITINIEDLKKLNIENNILIRYLYLCCYSNYNNKITIAVNKTRHKNLLKEDLINMLNMSKGEAYRTIKCLTDNELIYINDDSIILNRSYCTKGNNNYKNKLKIFINSYLNIYSNIDPRKHKTLGNILNNSICSKNLIYDEYTLEKYGNKTRIKRYIESIENLGKFNKNEIILNPNTFYCGYLDFSYKDIINKYEVNVNDK